MFEFGAGQIQVGDEFTTDEGRTWWRASRVEPRTEGRVWIEAQGHKGEVSSQTYAADDKFIVK